MIKDKYIILTQTFCEEIFKLLTFIIVIIESQSLYLYKLCYFIKCFYINVLKQSY